MKILSSLVVILWITGCAGTKPGLYPAASQQFPVDSQAVEGQSIRVKQGASELLASATVVNHVIAVSVEFTNSGSTSRRIQPSHFTLADHQGRLLAPVDLDQRIRDLRRRADKARDDAEKIDRERKESEARKKDSTVPKTVKDVDAAFGVLDKFLGESPATLRANADSATREADVYANKKSDTADFFASEVGPSQKLGGVLYFELPKDWPATLLMRVDTDHLGVTFSKETPAPH